MLLADNWQEKLLIKQKDRLNLSKHKPMCLWFEGLSGSGKSTLINHLDQYLVKNNFHTYVLDGDNLRLRLNSDLGFSDNDRNENLRRAAEVSSLMVDAGLLVLAGFITPNEAQRKLIRSKFKDEQFIEIFISTPLDICEKRDIKGLYKKARDGKIDNFTGVSSPFEVPQNADLTIDTSDKSISECLSTIISSLNL
jgi:adenylyl-sulfate kinase